MADDSRCYLPDWVGNMTAREKSLLVKLAISDTNYLKESFCLLAVILAIVFLGLGIFTIKCTRRKCYVLCCSMPQAEENIGESGNINIFGMAACLSLYDADMALTG